MNIERKHRKNLAKCVVSLELECVTKRRKILYDKNECCEKRDNVVDVGHDGGMDGWCVACSCISEIYNRVELKDIAQQFGKKIVYINHKIVDDESHLAVNGIIARLFVAHHPGVIVETIRGKYLWDNVMTKWICYGLRLARSEHMARCRLVLFGKYNKIMDYSKQ